MDSNASFAGEVERNVRWDSDFSLRNPYLGARGGESQSACLGSALCIAA